MPLYYAASTGKVDKARMQIANKAIVNAPSSDGTTPLMMAAYSDSRAMVKLLLDAGADATMRNLDKKNAADWARDKGFNDLAGQLDALVKKVVAQREARRARDRANQAQNLPVYDGATDNAGPPAAKAENERASGGERGGQKVENY